MIKIQNACHLAINTDKRCYLGNVGAIGCKMRGSFLCGSFIEENNEQTRTVVEYYERKLSKT